MKLTKKTREKLIRRLREKVGKNRSKKWKKKWGELQNNLNSTGFLLIS